MSIETQNPEARLGLGVKLEMGPYKSASETGVLSEEELQKRYKIYEALIEKVNKYTH